MSPYWIECTEREIIELREAAVGVAVIPLGSIESHGPHLPLGADPLALGHLIQRVVKRETVAVLPMVHYSYVAAARRLPGAVHIDSELLIRWVEQIADECHRNGFDKVVLLHGHGGNVALHWMFCCRMLERDKPYAVYSIPVFGSKWEEIQKRFETPTGHACEMETSIDLAACPQHVKLDALGAKTFPEHQSPDVGAAHTPVGWVSRYPQMAVGEPQRATAEKGEAVLRTWADEVVDILRKIKRDEVTLREMRKYSADVRSVGGRKAKRVQGPEPKVQSRKSRRR